jgi:hypothetical protein
MALTAIPGQRLVTLDNLQPTEPCYDLTDFCTLINTDDILRIQLTQTPCDDDLVENGNFTNIDYYNYGWDGDQWAFSVSDDGLSGQACKVPGVAGALIADIFTGLAAQSYMKVTYRIFGMSKGECDVYVGGTLSRVVTENGVYEDYILSTMSDTLLSFSADADFDGCVTNVTAYRLFNSAELSSGAMILDSDGNIVAGTSGVQVIKDKVNYVWEFTALSNIPDDACYYLQITDPCGDTFAALTFAYLKEFNTFVTNGDWTITGTNADVDFNFYAGGGFGGEDVTTSHIQMASYPSPTAFNAFAYKAYTFTPGMYVIKAEVTLNQSGSWGNGITTGPMLYLILPTGATAESFPILPIGATHLSGQTRTAFTTYFTVTINNPVSSLLYGVNFYNKFGISIAATNSAIEDSDYTFELQLSIGEVTGEYVAGDYFQLTNCFKVEAETDDTKLLIGYPDDSGDFPSNTETTYSQGFVFNNYYFPYLEERVKCSFLNPHTEIKTDNYLYSSGIEKKTFSQNTKLWDLHIDPVDNIAHDCIQAIISMEHLYIGDSITDITLNNDRLEYVTEEKQYQPDWPDAGASNVAPSQIEIKHKLSTRFKNY